MYNKYLKASILEVVDNQLNSKDPICTFETYNRLSVLGYSDKQVKEMIAAVLVEEMYVVLKENQSFDEKRFSGKLALLPGTFSAAKVGRNEMCPCGSGKKYKKCCGRQQ